jgi:flagellum-specific peptidoglycan hydrolase FlgJ
MKFFKQNSKEEYNKQVHRHTAEEDEFAQEWKEISDATNRHYAEKVNDGVCE